MGDNVDKILGIFKALSCKPRLDIVLELLGNHPCNVGLLADKLNIPQPNVSQHLVVLKNAGIIEGYRRGAQVYYQVIDEKTIQIIKVMELNNGQRLADVK